MIAREFDSSPHSVRLSCYGVRFEVSASSASLLRQIQQKLPPLSRPTRAATIGRSFGLRQRSDAVDIYINGRWETLSRTPALAVESLRLRIKTYVAEFSPGRTFVHGGVVAVDGHGVLVPGRSMSGKTTLVAALVRAGATYYSDEYAVIGADGLVRPFPQPLGMRQPGAGTAQQDVHAAEIGAEIGVAPIRLAMVVASRFEAGTTWRPRRLSPAETVLALLEHTVSAQRYPARALSLLTKATTQAVGLRGARGEADATAGLILERLRVSARTR